MSVCYDHLWSNGILLIATAMDPMLVILSSNHVGTSSSAPEEPKNTGLRLSACTREEETWRHLVTASFDQRNNSCSIGPDRTSHVVSWYHVINCNNGFYQSKHAASTKNSNAKDLSFSLPNKKTDFCSASHQPMGLPVSSVMEPSANLKQMLFTASSSNSPLLNS